MKSNKKAWIVLSIFMFANCWSIASNGQSIPTDTGDHCRDDAIAFMDKHFGHDLTPVDWERDTHSGPAPHGHVVFIVHFEECSGALVMVTGNSDFCQLPHYWHRGSYIRRVFATGDCKEFLLGEMSRHDTR